MLLHKIGEVVSIFIAPPAGPNPPPAGGYSKCSPMVEIKNAELVKSMGIKGDRWFGVNQFKLKNGNLKNFQHNRNVSLFSLEDLLEIKKTFKNIEAINLRRNIFIKNIEIKKIKKIIINDVMFQFSGFCHACEHIEKVNNLPGLSNVLCELGGIRMEVLSNGSIKTGDKIEVL
jgi:hypothetical protein